MNTQTFWKLFFPAVLLSALVGMVVLAQTEGSGRGPLKILLVAGGCCHDYATQTALLKAGIEERLNAEVTVEYNPDKSTKARFEIYNSPDWAKNYDVVIHDECTASVDDREYVNRILDAHRNGVPAVNLHCAMHSYRWGDIRNPVQKGADNAGWFEMIGLQSTGHGPQSPIEITFSKEAHPTLVGLENWTTINEELYNNIHIFEGTTVLARGTQIQKPKKKNDEATEPAPVKAEAVVVWAHEYGPKKTRIFSTSLGHNNETVADARYLDLVTRGILWATGNISQEGKAIGNATKP